MTRCWLSEHHACITTDNSVLPCTRYRKRNGAPNLRYTNLKDAFNSSYLKNIRKDLQQGIKLPGCQKCWNQEDANVLSMRQEYNGAWTGTLQSIEIAFSNHCNYACRHCDSFSSSKWFEDDLKLGRDATSKLIEPNFEMLNNLQDVTYIKILGGEPLINKTHNKFLKKLDNIKNITLEYSTNGSVYPSQDIIDIWEQAKHIKLSVSLDDIFDAFEYFRTGSDFSAVTKNIQKFYELDIFGRFHICINVLNLHRLPLIVKWCEQNFPNWHVNFDMVYNPLFLNIGQFALQDVEEILETLISAGQIRAAQLIQNCNFGNETDLSLFFKNNDILDASRNTNLKEVHPILETYR